MSTRSAHRKAREILEFVRAHPGCGTEDIDVTGKKSVVDSALLQLSMAGLVENREDPDVPPRWYPIEIPPSSLYLSLANDLLTEMETLPHDQRKVFLAKHLEAMMKAS